VPGLLREKCIQMVKGLPKALRKNLVPVPDFVDRALVELSPQDHSLYTVLAARLQALTVVRIAATDFQPEKLDDYYRMNFRIVDADGQLVRQGRDLGRLVESSREQTRDSLRVDESEGPTAKGLTQWPGGELPTIWRSRQAGVDIESYPALVDRGDSVDVELLDYPQQAQLSHRQGLLRLYRLQCVQPVRYLRKQLLRGNVASLALAGAGMSRESLLEDLIDATFARVLLPGLDLPRAQSEFDSVLHAGRGNLVTCGNEFEMLMLNTLPELGDIRQRLAALDGKQYAHLRADIEGQLAGLFFPGFMTAAPHDWLTHYPRYSKAIVQRLQRFSGQQQKDIGHTQMLEELSQPLREYLIQSADSLRINPELMRYRWLLEELRVSFFAQALGTSVPVSAKRIQEQWGLVEQWKIQNPV
jgi:ATP-dependent helicase HrpA